jgi:hypothetical protein
MKALTRVERAFCDASSAIITVNGRGVSGVLADAYADTMDDPENGAITGTIWSSSVLLVSLIENTAMI